MTYLRYGYNLEIGWLLLCAVLSSDFQLFLQPAPMAQLGALPEKAAPGLFCNTWTSRLSALITEEATQKPTPLSLIIPIHQRPPSNNCLPLLRAFFFFFSTDVWIYKTQSNCYKGKKTARSRGRHSHQWNKGGKGEEGLHYSMDCIAQRVTA